MALYEYKCSDCEERFELMRPMSAADDLAECPERGGTESRRLISNFTSITPGASTLSTNPVMDARIASGGGGCCGGGRWGPGSSPRRPPTSPPRGPGGATRGGFRG